MDRLDATARNGWTLMGSPFFFYVVNLYIFVENSSIIYLYELVGTNCKHIYKGEIV